MAARRRNGVLGIATIVVFTASACASLPEREKPASVRDAASAAGRTAVGNQGIDVSPARVAVADASVPRSPLRDRATEIIGFAAALGLGGLAATVWRERRRRAIADFEATRQLATVVDLDRPASMGELAASLAHELQQPLGAILRNAEAAAILLRSARPRLDELREIVDDIRKDDKRATEIIRRMRTMLCNHDLQEEPVDLNEIARETAAFVAPDAAARLVRLELDLQNAPAMVFGDRVHLQQVLLNIVLNGMDSMRDTPSEHRRLVVATATIGGGSHVQVVVRDSGSGIPRDAITRVFDPFFTTKRDGMGMGLSIARSIIEAHHGRILAENNVDRGATVRVSLPLRVDRTRARPPEHLACHAS
jgi:signal transduction histidine kinase